ncbi:hypothetical protein KEJ50_03925 [Candidatus Bathyarchaeota archaeon]|nr:hypothetical protein [Candidatus Bathyarchaeota archaeon]
MATSEYPLEKPIKPPLSPAMSGIIKNEFELGYVAELTDYFIEERKRMNLKPVPPTSYERREAAEQIQKLSSGTEFEEKVKAVKKFKGELPKVIPC